jgi:hypothetical protein
MKRFLLVLMLAAAAAGARGALAQVSAEAWVSRSDPYVREAVLYTVRVYSTRNVQSVELSPPTVSGASLEELEGSPVSGEAMLGGVRYVTNDFRYVVTPLRAGPVEIGAAELVVRVAEAPGWGGYPGGWSAMPRERTLRTEPVQLSVAPAAAQGGAWRPLQYLDLKAHWSGLEAAEQGEPLTLTVVVKARGARGDQLPSVTSQLAVPGLKVYPERPQAESRVTGNGTYLWGRRIETFTLVPTREGVIELPSLALDWWDVSTDSPATTAVPQRLLLVGDEARESMARAEAAETRAITSRMFSDHALYFFVLPLGGGLAIAFAIGLWVGSGGLEGERARALATRARHAGAAAAGGLRAAVAAVLPARLRARMAGWLVPRWRALRHRLLVRLMEVMPARAKVWWCVRCVDSAPDAAGLCSTLRRFACTNLQMSPNTSLQDIATRISAEHPRADAGDLQRLFRELDDSLYGGSSLSLRDWKRRFRSRFRRTLRSPHRERLERRLGLPDLNP